MKRSKLFYTVFISFALSDAAFAAEQDAQTDNRPQSQTATPAHTAAKPAKARIAQDELVEVRGHGRSSVMASSATKTNTPLVETAQSVTVITRDEMDTRGVLTLNQAVRYAAGITADTRGGEGTRYDLFDLRGFTVPTFLDGLKLQDSPMGFAIAQTDTSRLERVELLKGPASALYGQSSPGGLRHCPASCQRTRSFTVVLIQQGACSTFTVLMPMSAGLQRMMVLCATGCMARSMGSIPSLPERGAGALASARPLRLGGWANNPDPAGELPV